MNKGLVVFSLLLVFSWSFQASFPGGPDSPKVKNSSLLRPISLLLVDQGNRLLVVNRDNGTITVLDTGKMQKVNEVQIGGKLSAMAATENLLLVTDELAGEIVFLERSGNNLRPAGRRKVGPSPVSIQISDDAKLATVACLWPRRLMILDLEAIRKPIPDAGSTPLDLPFAPRYQLFVPKMSKVIVADSFGGKLAIVDPRMKKVESVRSFPIHNIRGLTLSPDRKSLWLSHQMLNSQGRTVPGEIQAGNVISNNLQQFFLADILQPGVDVFRTDRLYPVGDIERGAGDPAGLAILPDGQVVVTLAGVNQVALGRPESAIWTRLNVGRRPTALAIDEKNRRIYVANTFSDAISVIDPKIPRVVAEIPLGNPIPAGNLKPEQRGEMLFYDATLSFEGWYSCHSCHPDGHTNGRLNDNFTDGSFGTPKRVLTLLGVRDTGPWAWNGHMADLETQVRTSITSTMQGRPPSEEKVRDLTAYLKTLAPPPSLLKARGNWDPDSARRGRKIFTRLKCGTCHTPPLFTSAKTYDVGLRDEAGKTRFNPPSLRGLGQAGPFFHDNRAATLEEVFTRYRHQITGVLSRQDLDDLRHFLE